MSDNADESLSRRFKAYIREFGVLRQTRREYWAVQIIAFLDYAAYFALMNIGVVFLSEDFGFTDSEAGQAFTLFASSVAVFLLLMGSVSDWLGIRGSVCASMLGLLILRAVLVLCSLCPDLPYRGVIVTVDLGLMAPFVALWQTTWNSANKRFTNEHSRGAGFNLAYLAMNAGAVVAGLLIDLVRLQLHLPNGWIMVFGLFTAAVGVVISLGLVRREEEACVATDSSARRPEHPRHPLASSWLVVREAAFWRFIVLVILLLGVKAVFVWGPFITMKYALRVVGPDAAIGTLSTINPTVIVLGLIVLIPVLRRFNVFSMLVYGAMVTGASLFVLVIPSWGSTAYVLLIVHTVILSVGELIWSPRLSEYTVAIAPRGQEGTYVGLASFPWFVAKTIASALSGYMLVRWIPELPNGSLLRDRLAAGQVPFWDSPSALWLVLGLVALAGPVIALFLRNWFTTPARQEEKILR
jgi:MFS family permease